MPFILCMASFPLLQGCASRPVKAVHRVQARETPPPGWHWNDSQKALVYGDEKKTPEGNLRKLPPGVKEVTPLSAEKTYTAITSRELSKKDLIRLRFPGKKVVFPEEIKPSEKKPDYRIGPEDVLQILIWNQADLSLPEITVRTDGWISLPLIGNLKAEGLTVPELEQKISARLARFITDPQVTVNPKEMNSQRIFLVGQVRRASLTGGPLVPAYYFKGGATLIEALSDVELSPEVDLPASYVLREDFVIPLDIKALLLDGDLTQNILLNPGDRIVVPGMMKEVNLLGEFQGPGKYKIRMDSTLLDALSLARGVKRETADLYMAYMARKKQILPVNFKRLLDLGDMSQNILVEDGDIVYIPNNDDKKYFVLGEVSKPGVVNFKDPVDVIEAIAQSGGFLTTAQRSQVVVVRGDLYSPQIYEVNLLAMMEGKSFERFPLQKRDIVYVPRTYIADWNLFINQIFPTFQGIVLLDVLRRH